MKPYRPILALLIWMIVSVASGQTNVNTQVQLAEQKVKIENLEKEQKELKEEISRNNDALEKKKEYLDNRETVIDNWLSALGILVTVFGVAIPIGGFFFGKKIMKDVDEQTDKAEKFMHDAKNESVNQISETKERVKELRNEAKELKEEARQMILDARQESSKLLSDTESKIQELENTAKEHIRHLEACHKEGDNIVAALNILSKNVNDVNLTDDQKNELVNKVKGIESDDNATQFEQDMLKAIKLYTTHEYQESIDQNLLLLSKYADQITLNQAADIFFRLAYAFGELNNQEKAIYYYDKVIDIAPDDYIAHSNWGVCLGKLAITKSGADAERLYLEAFKKYQKAIEIKPDDAVAYLKWGTDLGNFAKSKSGADADRLYLEAFEKYQNAIEFKPDYALVYSNWGTVLGYLARTKSGADAERLYLEAFEKYQKAIEIKPDDSDTYCKWGTDLGYLAITKSGVDAERLYLEAFEKYQKTIEIKPDYVLAYLNWGTDLGDLAKSKSIEEATLLFRQAIEKLMLGENLEPGSCAFNLACFNSLLNDLPQAIHWLTVGIDLGTITSYKELDEDPDLDNIRSNTEFQEILSRLKAKEE